MAKIVISKVMDEKETDVIKALRQGIKDYIENCERLAESSRAYGDIAQGKAESIRAEAGDTILKLLDAIIENV